MFRNSSGILRNISSAGDYGRKKLRECEGLVDSVLYLVKKAIEKANIDNKSVENCVCVLRNLSYRAQEVDDPNYDKVSNISERSVAKKFKCLNYRSIYYFFPSSIWVYLRENPELAPNPTVIIWAVLVLEVIQKMVAQIRGSQEEGKTLNQRPTIMVLGALVDQLERVQLKEWSCYGNLR